MISSSSPSSWSIAAPSISTHHSRCEIARVLTQGFTQELCQTFGAWNLVIETWCDWAIGIIGPNLGIIGSNLGIIGSNLGIIGSNLGIIGSNQPLERCMNLSPQSCWEVYESSILPCLAVNLQGILWKFDHIGFWYIWMKLKMLAPERTLIPSSLINPT